MKKTFLAALVLSIFVIAVLSDYSARPRDPRLPVGADTASASRASSTPSNPLRAAEPGVAPPPETSASSRRTTASIANESDPNLRTARRRYLQFVPPALRDRASAAVHESAGETLTLQLEIDGVAVENTDVRLTPEGHGAWEFHTPVFPALVAPAARFPSTRPEEIEGALREQLKTEAPADIRVQAAGAVWLPRAEGLTPCLKFDVDQIRVDAPSRREVWCVQADTREVLSRNVRVRN
jgi:hypothetical protein